MLSQTTFIPLQDRRTSLVLALLLLLLLAFAQYSSDGAMRNGGDDEDSGIGGTGFTIPPTNEGGIGGTGLRPFITVNDVQEVEVQWDPVRREQAVVKASPAPVPRVTIDLQPVPSPATVARDSDRTSDSSAIDISEAIQVSLDTDALIVASLQQELTELEIDTDFAMSSPASNTAPADADKQPESESAPSFKSWADLARAMSQSSPDPVANENTAANGNLARVDYNADNPARLQRPDPVQRPQLPPIQRVSPLSRTAILPPRVKPLRL